MPKVAKSAVAVGWTVTVDAVIVAHPITFTRLARPVDTGKSVYAGFKIIIDRLVLFLINIIVVSDVKHNRSRLR